METFIHVHLPYKHDPNNINGIHVCFLNKVSYLKKEAMNFFWDHDNGKINRISRSRYAQLNSEVLTVSLLPSKNREKYS